HRAKPQRRACDARAEPRPRPRRDPRGERLRGDDPQEREADPSPAEGRGEEVAMPTVPVLDATGKQAGTMELKGDVFSVEIRVPLLHQAVTRELTSLRPRVAAGSPGNRRGPVARVRARSARPSGRAAGSPSVRSRA